MPFSGDGAFPDEQVASSIDTNAPPYPTEMQVFELSADKEQDDPSAAAICRFSFCRLVNHLYF